jgi:endonuclease/exonuclease/phosphatase family metal-dependent hydrolase
VVLSEASSTPGAIDSLIVVTWNIRAGAGDVPEFVSQLRSGTFTGVADPHFVLLLQEAYRAGPEVPVSAPGRLTSRIDIAPPSGERIDVTDLARQLDLHLYYAPSMPNGAPLPRGPAEDRGNAILSTIPLEDLAAIELPFEVQRRVAVSASVSGVTATGRRWSLRVASGHLDTRARWSRFIDSFGAGRARQAVALSEHLDGDAVVLGADLNTWSAAFLEGALPVLYSRFPDTSGPTGATFVAGGVFRRRLDHFLTRLPPGHQAEVRKIPDRFGSDHFPLVGVVRFETAD